MPLLQLEGNTQEYVEDRVTGRVERLEREVAELQAALINVQKQSVVTLLNVLHAAMKEVASGKFDLKTPEVEVSGGSSKWEAIRQKYAGTRTGDVIGVLMLHGPMNQSQLAAALKTSNGNMSGNIIPQIKSLGLIVRDGSMWKLKEF